METRKECFSQNIFRYCCFPWLALFPVLNLRKFIVKFIKTKGKLRWRIIFKFVGNKCIYFCNKAFEGFCLFVCLFYLPCIHSCFQVLIELVVGCVHQILTNFSYELCSGIILICSISFIELFTQIHPGWIPEKCLPSKRILQRLSRN